MPTPPPPIDSATQEQVLNQFRAWMLSLPDERMDMLGVDGGAEEPMRLLSAYAREKGLALGEPRTSGRL